MPGPTTLAETIWKKFRNKDYRDGFVESRLATLVAAQVFSLRQGRGWTQSELAKRIGTSQGRISDLENPDQPTFTVSTLRKIASAFDVALTIKFVPFSEILHAAVQDSSSDLAPPEFKADRPVTQAQLGPGILAFVVPGRFGASDTHLPPDRFVIHQSKTDAAIKRPA